MLPYWRIKVKDKIYDWFINFLKTFLYHDFAMVTIRYQYQIPNSLYIWRISWSALIVTFQYFVNVRSDALKYSSNDGKSGQNVEKRAKNYLRRIGQKLEFRNSFIVLDDVLNSVAILDFLVCKHCGNYSLVILNKMLTSLITMIADGMGFPKLLVYMLKSARYYFPCSKI